MVYPEDIKNHIAQGMVCTHLQVDGDGRHFQALVVSAEFAGLSRVQRHQRVYAVLGAQMRDELVHAFSMTTLTPEEWQVKNG
ncbi:MAG: BolA/IbaG family iron-sulfur metabolism protein [Rhodocyclaceae bacterium]|nr:BolA/IbaG family iron-sulfur metabolism protein [Rhodocyclaceae bacterium]